MKKLILFLFICPLFINGQETVNKNSIKSQEAVYTDSTTVGRFKIRFTNQFDDNAKLKVKKGLYWLDSIVGTDHFRDKVEKLKYKNTKIKNKVNLKCVAEKRTNKRYSSEDIYDLLINGDDGLGQPNDKIIDLYLDLDPDLSGNVLGSTSCGRIKSGKLYFSKNSAEVYAAHLIHEYMHVLGFNHFLNNPFLRSLFFKKNDPAYQIGKFVKSLVPE